MNNLKLSFEDMVKYKFDYCVETHISIMDLTRPIEYGIAPKPQVNVISYEQFKQRLIDDADGDTPAINTADIITYATDKRDCVKLVYDEFISICMPVVSVCSNWEDTREVADQHITYTFTKLL